MCLEEAEMTEDESSDQHSDMDTSPTTSISPEQMDTKLYNKCVTFMIRKPFPQDYITLENPVVWANRKISDEQVLIFTILKKDFKKDGKYAHLFIPKYPYVPVKILNDLGITAESRSATIYNLWRHCSLMRKEAAIDSNEDYRRNLGALPGLEKIPWLKLLTDHTVAKSFPFDTQDIVQYQQAWSYHGNSSIHTLDSRELYDCFFRPLERLCTMDMPMTQLL